MTIEQNTSPSTIFAGDRKLNSIIKWRHPYHQTLTMKLQLAGDAYDGDNGKLFGTSMHGEGTINQDATTLAGFTRQFFSAGCRQSNRFPRSLLFRLMKGDLYAVENGLGIIRGGILYYV